MAINRTFVIAAQVSNTSKKVWHDFLDLFAAGVTIAAQTITALSTGGITGTDSSLGVTGVASTQGGAVALVGGASSTSANAGGAVTLAGGAPGATGVGGAVSATAAAGGATSGAGGAVSLVGGAGTAGNAAGGAASVTAGAGQGSAAGGAASLVSGVGGATGAGGAVAVTAGAGGATSGTGGAVAVTAGAGTAGNANGGSITLTPGAKNGSGYDGQVIVRGVLVRKQGAATAKTTSATLTAAEIEAKIITVAQGGAGSSAQQLPLASAMDTGFPNMTTDDSFDFSVINTSTVDAEDASITTNTGWTLVGSMDIPAYSAAGSLNSSALFRARKTGTATWTLYRIS